MSPFVQIRRPLSCFAILLGISIIIITVTNFSVQKNMLESSLPPAFLQDGSWSSPSRKLPYTQQTQLRLPPVRTRPPLPDEELPRLDPTMMDFDAIIMYETPLKDHTVHWRKNVYRAWLDENRTVDPPAMLVLTKFGWNQRNMWNGMVNIRSMRQRELLEGVLNHPWFHPLEWDLIEQKKNHPRPNVRYYVFLDLETCMDKNYPHYLNRTANLDQIGKRGRRGKMGQDEALEKALMNPIMSLPQSRIVVFDCRGGRRSKDVESLYWTRDQNQNPHLVLASVSARSSDHINMDMGLPPGACNKCISPFALSPSCHSENEQRPFLLTFVGNFRAETRQKLRKLHNGKDILIGEPDEIMKILGVSDEKEAFQIMATKSKFAAVPRGDNLFSYRFAEVTSCGAIPVVYADDWVFPFRQELAPPRDYAVVINEENVTDSIQILSEITPEKQCQLRRRSLEMYELYFKTGEGVIHGIIDSLEILQQQSTKVKIK